MKYKSLLIFWVFCSVNNVMPVQNIQVAESEVAKLIIARIKKEAESKGKVLTEAQVEKIYQDILDWETYENNKNSKL